MMVVHRLRCACGNLQGAVRNPGYSNRGICYCRDCQAFAHFLGKSLTTLDAQGGTQVIQTIQANVSFTHGTQYLACKRLTEEGMLRWYSSCCRTPIGNTPADYRTSFIGLIHTCLQDPEHSLDQSFGPIRMAVNTKGAIAATPIASKGMLSGIWRFLCMVLRARINGDYRRSPFFHDATGNPVVKPEVLDRTPHS
jgi:hypothetical protein